MIDPIPSPDGVPAPAGTAGAFAGPSASGPMPPRPESISSIGPVAIGSRCTLRGSNNELSARFPA
jgi:hypothetical protein